jgi:hypothetical protein
MKFYIAILLSVFAILMSSCNNNEKTITNKWVIKSVSVNLPDISEEDKAAFAQIYEGNVYDFKADGSLSMTKFEKTIEGKWKFKGDFLELSFFNKEFDSWYFVGGKVSSEPDNSIRAFAKYTNENSNIALTLVSSSAR